MMEVLFTSTFRCFVSNLKFEIWFVHNSLQIDKPLTIEISSDEDVEPVDAKSHDPVVSSIFSSCDVNKRNSQSINKRSQGKSPEKTVSVICKMGVFLKLFWHAYSFCSFVLLSRLNEFSYSWSALIYSYTYFPICICRIPLLTA